MCACETILAHGFTNTGRLGEPFAAGRDFSFEAATIRSGSAGVTAAEATMQKSVGAGLRCSAAPEATRDLVRGSVPDR
jgi:hypothetical protein